jgi:hypothetical protein
MKLTLDVSFIVCNTDWSPYLKLTKNVILIFKSAASLWAPADGGHGGPGSGPEPARWPGHCSPPAGRAQRRGDRESPEKQDPSRSNLAECSNCPPTRPCRKSALSRTAEHRKCEPTVTGGGTGTLADVRQSHTVISTVADQREYGSIWYTCERMILVIGAAHERPI